MSVLIKGMEMPKSCEDCNFYYTDYEEGTATCLATSCYVIPQQYNKGNRDSDCPLVAVPTPHGRLIDADELIRCIEHAFGDKDIVKLVANIIERQPTIIEAEVSEE